MRRASSLRSNVASIVGVLIRERRHLLGMTQEGLAAEVGVETVTVRRWELGLRLPRDVHALQVLKALHAEGETWEGMISNKTLQTPNETKP